MTGWACSEAQAKATKGRRAGGAAAQRSREAEGQLDRQEEARNAVGSLYVKDTASPARLLGKSDRFLRADDDVLYLLKAALGEVPVLTVLTPVVTTGRPGAKDGRPGQKRKDGSFSMGSICRALGRP